MRCHITDTTRKDTVFVPFHWNKHQSINLLIGKQLDLHSKMPGFKILSCTAVSLQELKTM